MSHPGQHPHGDMTVGRVVLGEQNLQIAARGSTIPSGRVRPLLDRRAAHLDVETERTSLAQYAVDLYRAAHQGHHPRADREGEPGATEAAGDRRVPLGGRPEKV